MTEHLSRDQLISYVCRTLTDAQREKMDIHIGMCQECRGRLAGYETLHRRLRYSVMDWRRGGSMSPGATFAAIAPRLRRSRRMAMFWTGSKQFVYGAATLAGLVVLVVGLIAFFGGIGQLPAIAPAPTPTPLPGEDLVGVWARADEGLYLQFDLDGTFRVATAISFLETAPSDLGQFRLDRTSLTYISSSESPSCADQIGSYHVELTEGGQLEFTTQEDPCQIRDYVSTAALWDRISQDDLPLGAYITTITGEDSRDQDIYGDWELKLSEGARYSFTLGRGVSLPVAEGHYTVTPDQIVFTDEKGYYGHQGCIDLGAETGTYKWAFDGQALTLTTVEDECPSRNDLITAHPWTKQD